LVFRPISSRRIDAWHAPDFAAAGNAAAIDFDAHFVTLTALVAKKIKGER
jgi:hypothetical protein